MTFLRTPYNYDRDEVSNETGLSCPEPSLAQQHMKDEADINTIVRRFGLTGELPSGVRMPQYGDFTGVTDYHSAMNAVISAQDSFSQLPAEVRARFNNDAAAFVDFCMDESNRAEAESLGLVQPKAVVVEPAKPVDPPST